MSAPIQYQQTGPARIHIQGKVILELGYMPYIGYSHHYTKMTFNKPKQFITLNDYLRKNKITQK